MDAHLVFWTRFLFLILKNVYLFSLLKVPSTALGERNIHVTNTAEQHQVLCPSKGFVVQRRCSEHLILLTPPSHYFFFFLNYGFKHQVPKTNFGHLRKGKKGPREGGKTALGKGPTLSQSGQQSLQPAVTSPLNLKALVTVSALNSPATRYCYVTLFTFTCYFAGLVYTSVFTMTSWGLTPTQGRQATCLMLMS